MSETDMALTNVCREAVGVFHHWAALQAAVDELLHNGFDRAEISMLAGEEVVERKLGHVYEKVSELEDDPNAPRIGFVGRDSLTEGKASAIGALGYVGAVAAVGAVVASGGALAWVLLAGAAAAVVARHWGACWPRHLPRQGQGYRGANQQGRPAAVGAHLQPGSRGSGDGNPEEARRRGRARA